MVYALDENMGRLLAKLDELRLKEKTVVIFTSYNGGLSTLRRGPGPTSVRPLRAGKGWCYEGGIRVPLIIRAPGMTQAGSDCGEPVVSMDFFPTLLELAGEQPQPDRHVDGLSLVPLLTAAAKSLDREALYWHYPHYHGSGWTPGAAVRAGDWKLVEFFESGEAQLFRLSDSEEEQQELSQRHPEQFQQMRELLFTWRKRTGAKLPQAQ
jgi:arylsulfatase A-like enzyme